MTTDSTGNIGPDHNLMFNVQKTGSEVDIGVSASNHQNADIQVDGNHLIPANQVETHFADSNQSDGNTMLCLEQALLDEAGQGNLTGTSREEALTNLKVGVTGIRGKLLKENNRADSPVVADTHTDPSTGLKYYKFLTTWEIDVNINDTTKTIKKSQWTVTGVEQPKNFSDPEQIRLQQHRALLAVKCHRHIHKAAFNQQHRDYTYVRDCVDDLRQTNLVGLQGYTNQNRMMFSTQRLDLTATSDDRSKQVEESIVKNEAALSLGVRLFDRSGKKIHIHIDQSQDGRKINEVGDKYLKEEIDRKNPDQSLTPLAYKRKEQGDLMITRGNSDFSRFMKALHAKPEDIEGMTEADRFEGKNERGLTFEQVKSELLKARKTQAKIYKKNVKLAGQKFQAAIIQTYADKIGDSKMKAVKFMLRQQFTSEDKFTKHLIKELAKENLKNEERKHIQDALNEYKSENDTLRVCEQGNDLMNYDENIDRVRNDSDLSLDIKNFTLAYLEESWNARGSKSGSKTVKGHQELIDLATPLIKAEA